MDDICSIGWSFILKEGISGNVDNFCLDATSMNSGLITRKNTVFSEIVV